MQTLISNVSIDSWQCRMEIDMRFQSIHSWQCKIDKLDHKLLSLLCSVDHSWQRWSDFNMTLSFDDKSSATLKLVVASVTNEELKGWTNVSLAHFEQLPVRVSIASTSFNSKISSIFQLVVAFVANKCSMRCHQLASPRRKWTLLIWQKSYQVDW